MVTSQKIDEKKMEYRVSKSILFLIKIVFYLTIIFIWIYFLVGAKIVLLSAAIIPAVVYGNADLEKSNITIGNKKKAGVYRWVNKNNGKCYVGSSINLSNRFYFYFNLKAMLLTSKNSLIARALLKYGYSNFQLEILEYCDPSKCIEREQYYIDLLKPEYNILKLAGSRLGSKQSVEARDKISLSLIGNKRSVGGKRSGNPCIVLDVETGVKTRYEKINLAAKALGSSPKALRKYLKRNSGKPFKGRYFVTKLKPDIS